MTDTQEKEPTAADKKLADAYAKASVEERKKLRQDNPNKSFRLRVVGGETVVVAKKLGK